VTPVWDVISDLFYLMGHRQAEGGARPLNCQTAWYPPFCSDYRPGCHSSETTVLIVCDDGGSGLSLALPRALGEGALAFVKSSEDAVRSLDHG
jgi:hypothetical protein